MLRSLVNAVCPSFNWETKDVAVTHDSTAWYRVGREKPTLFVPPVKLLKSNVRELDRFVEALKNFSIANLNEDKFRWLNLNLSAYKGEDCIEILKKMKEDFQGKEIAVDIETRKISYNDNALLAIGFAYDENSCIALYDIPLSNVRAHGGSVNSGYPATLQFRTFNALNDLLSDPNITFIWHNGQFDCTRLKYLCDINARVDEDTMLKHYACINEKKGTHGLKDLGPLYLQAPQWDDELDSIKKEYCKKNKIKLADFTYDLIPLEVLVPYMQRDCIATYRLLQVFKELARPESDFIYRKLIEATNIYGQVELNGFKVDLLYLEDLEFDLENKLYDAQKHLDEVASIYWDPLKYAQDTGAKSLPKEGFNMKSPKQLKWLLEKVLKYKIDSTDAETLEMLSDMVSTGAIDSEGAKELLESIMTVRKYSKQMDTYVQGIRNVVCSDCRVRGSYKLHGTETGRLSSSDPNMQNIPRDKTVKNLFVADKGYKLLQLDYSQAELRVLAMLSGDEWLTKVYQDGKDLHDAVAIDMFGPDFTKEQRVMAKTINFGIAYGRGPGSLATTFGMTMQEARNLIDKWYAPMPNVKKYIEKRRRMPLDGIECVTIFGRQRHFVITNENLNHVQNEYINTPIQSAASDFTMFSLIEIQKWLNENSDRIDAKIVATVHDSIILEVIDKKEIIDEVAQECCDIMATTPSVYVDDLQVPFRADAEVGYSWGALSEWHI